MRWRHAISLGFPGSRHLKLNRARLCFPAILCLACVQVRVLKDAGQEVPADLAAFTGQKITFAFDSDEEFSSASECDEPVAAVRAPGMLVSEILGSEVFFG